jgi:peptide-methionine (S)-S-oxide reductase
VGYAGGTKRNPTYHSLGDHTETVEVDFDPEKISYRELLNIFWESHNPESRSWSRQYMAAVFYHDPGQRRLAEETRDGLARKTGGKILTAVLPYTGFHLAEDYHQKHALRRFPELLEEFEAMYPSPGGLVSSTAAARVNGYLAGYGTCEALRGEIEGFGLSERGRGMLLRIVCGRNTTVTCAPPG